MTSTLAQVLRLSDLDPDAFYSPEFLAPVLGFTKWELRDYCRRSGIHTRLAKNRIALDVASARQLIEWVKDSKKPTKEELEENPFL